MAITAKWAMDRVTSLNMELQELTQAVGYAEDENLTRVESHLKNIQASLVTERDALSRRLGATQLAEEIRF